MPLTGIGVAPATAGELVQGTLDNQDFLITSPINLFSSAQAEVTLFDPEIRVNPDGDYAKVKKAVRLLLDRYGFTHCGAVISFSSAIPRGKGLASSTSEMLAAMRAILKACRHTSSPTELAKIATEVESSDALFFPGVVRSNPLTGKLYESYGPPPPLGFILVDTGGEVLTESYDRAKARAHSQKNSVAVSKAVDLVREGMRVRSPRLIAKGATISACLQQSILYKPPFKDLLQGSTEQGALGVNCAHTGTVLGVMFDPRSASQFKLERRVNEIVGASQNLGTYRLIGSDARLA